MTTSRLNIDRSSIYQIALLTICFLLAYGSILGQLVQIWYTNEDYSHGFLIIPISAILLWMRRESLASDRHEPSLKWGIPLLIVALLLYMGALLAEIATVAAVSMILAIVAITICYFGFDMVKKALFPLCFLLFMVPIPAQIYADVTQPLQRFVSQITVFVVDLAGIPIWRDGNIIHLPNATLQVVEACSGLRSMISLSALSALYALTARGYVNRILVFAAAVPISIAVNAFRVSATAYLTYHFGKEKAVEGLAHELLGISVFVLSLVLLFFWKTILTKIASWMGRV